MDGHEIEFQLSSGNREKKNSKAILYGGDISVKCVKNDDKTNRKILWFYKAI